MPNPAKGPRIYLRNRKDRQPQWVILDDGPKEIATGARNREEAEKALADYITRKYEAPASPCHPNQMSIARALEIYGNEHAPNVASPETIGYHMAALLPFWGELPVSAIKRQTCTAYVKSRTVKPATAKRELDTLGAAVNYCQHEGYLLYAPHVIRPKVPVRRKNRWLTRSEAARLLWAARHVPHLRTFILIGLYTGTRSSAILSLQWLPNTQGGWIDLDAGLLYRAPEEWTETDKRRPTCPLSAKLIAHLRRARRRTRQFVVEYEGETVKKLRRSWRSACNAAGLFRDVTPHTLRHTAVTWRLQRGVKMWEVAGYVGMSEQMLRKHYGHHCPDFMQEARDAI